MPAHQRAHLGIARSFQVTALFSNLTVLENTLLAAQGNQPSRFQMFRSIISQLKRSGFSILLVEQNLPMALRVADYIYIISKGVIVYESAPQELRDNEEVKAKYIGVVG